MKIKELKWNDLTLDVKLIKNEELKTIISDFEFKSILQMFYNSFSFVGGDSTESFQNTFNVFNLMNSDNLSKLYDAFEKEYDPISNYDRTEITTTKNEYGTLAQSNLYGSQSNTTDIGALSTNVETKTSTFDSTDYVDGNIQYENTDAQQNRSTIGEKQDVLTTEEHTDDITVNSHISGNIGITSTVDLLTGETELRTKFALKRWYIDLFVKQFCFLEIE